MLISFLIGKRLKGFLELLAAQEVQFITGAELLGELAEVTARPSMRKHFAPAQVRALVDVLERLGEPVEIDLAEGKPLSRDPKDDYLLRMAKKGKADVLVTGDKDLLVLEQFGRTRILSVRTFTQDYLS